MFRVIFRNGEVFPYEYETVKEVYRVFGNLENRYREGLLPSPPEDVECDTVSELEEYCNEYEVEGVTVC